MSKGWGGGGGGAGLLNTKGEWKEEGRLGGNGGGWLGGRNGDGWVGGGGECCGRVWRKCRD